MKPRQHQVEGAVYLANRKRAILADVPGAGKTLTALLAMALAGLTDGALIICPAIVRSHWRRSIEEWNTFATKDRITNVRVMSYDEIVRGGIQLREKLGGFKLIILDEIHYCKHAKSQRTQLILGIEGYARRAKVVWGLSGTPVDKNPTSIWTVLSTFFPEIAVAHGVSSYRKFVAKFAVEYMRRIGRRTVPAFRPECKDPVAFKALCEAMWLRRSVLDVPPIDWQHVRLDPATHASVDYTIMGTKEMEAATQDGNLDKLRSIAADPEVSRARRRLGEYKCMPVAQLITSQLAGSDEKVAVFAHHLSVLDTLEKLLAPLGVVRIDGSTSEANRVANVQRFKDEPGIQVFLGQNLACGTGMDGLQYSGAKRGILVEPDWTATRNQQLGARLARTGAGAEPIVMQMIGLAGTLDEGIVALNRKEVALLAGVYE